MAVVLGLWSVILEPGKTHYQETQPGIQITNVSFGAEVKGDARTVVTIKYPEFVQDSDDEESDEDEDDDEENVKLPAVITKEAVLAILRPNHTEQVSINVTLVEDVEAVEFSVTGPNAVHLVGHYVRQEDFDQDPYSDSEDGYDSNDESLDSDMEGMSGMLGEESDDEERFEEVKESKKATNPKKRAAEDEDVATALLGAKDEEAGDVSMSSTLSKNQKKKAAKKIKTADGAAAPVVAAAAAVVAPVVAKKEEKKIEAPKKAAVPASKTLAGGLVITDSKVGEGPAAKSGKKVGMRYIGKLENGKVFDSNTKGAPLVFTLGRGEVIKGWDMGVAGMAVGGERKLVIPAALAYGKKGTQGIPGNATLHFDVKLVTLK